MSAEAQLTEESAEDLFEDAPCGYLATRLDGTVVRVNRTFERWISREREELVDRMRFQDLLTAGGRIYYEAHYAPLLQMQGSVQEIAVEIVRPDGTVLPALINSVLRRNQEGQPGLIRTTVFDATDRRRYEQELLRATRREHHVALSLQRSLLAGELPSSPAFGLEVFYAAAAAGLEVGGDWYDAFWLEEQRTVVLVVGDVVGRGLAAAAAMGQLRSAVRALASLSLPPAQLLDALDAYSRRHQVGAMTTLTYAELDLDTYELRFACAGHPPPLIVEPGDQPRFVWEARSVPINAYSGSEARVDHRVVLTPGTTIVLYTDGLVEHKRRDVEEGMNQLAELVNTNRDLPLKEMLDSVVRGMYEPATSDDRCAMVVTV